MIRGKIGFDVSFSGAADPGADFGSAFSVALYNQARVSWFADMFR